MENRRFTDISLIEKIEALIESEQDTKVRVSLLVHLQMAHLLVDYLHITDENVEKSNIMEKAFETHVANQNKLTDRGWGIWKVVSVALIGINGLIGFFTVPVINDYRETKMQLAIIQKDVIYLKEQGKIP